MSLHQFQKQIFQNKLNRGFNTTNVGKEILLMTEELGELSYAHLNQNQEEIIDALGDLMVYCLGLSAMFKFNPDSLINNLEKQNSLEKYIFCITKELGMLAKAYKKSNKQPVAELDKKEEFQTILGNLLSYCSLMLEYLDKEPAEVLAQIVENNKTRNHEGQI